jgi:hypothetical protein
VSLNPQPSLPYFFVYIIFHTYIGRLAVQGHPTCVRLGGGPEYRGYTLPPKTRKKLKFYFVCKLRLRLFLRRFKHVLNVCRYVCNECMYMIGADCSHPGLCLAKVRENRRTASREHAFELSRRGNVKPLFPVSKGTNYSKTRCLAVNEVF